MTAKEPERQISNNELVEAIEQDDKPVVGAGCVSERVGLSRQTCSKHLKRLADENIVKQGTVGKLATVYWVDD